MFFLAIRPILSDWVTKYHQWLTYVLIYAKYSHSAWFLDGKILILVISLEHRELAKRTSDCTDISKASERQFATKKN